MKSSTIKPPPNPTYPRSDADLFGANLGRIADALERIATALEANGAPRRREVGVLLRAIHARVADRVFVAPELIEYAEISDAEELRSAILAAVGSLNARRLGKRFAEIEGEEIDGYRLRRVGADRGGICWQVVRVSESANPHPSFPHPEIV